MLQIQLKKNHFKNVDKGWLRQFCLSKTPAGDKTYFYTIRIGQQNWHVHKTAEKYFNILRKMNKNEIKCMY